MSEWTIPDGAIVPRSLTEHAGSTFFLANLDAGERVLGVADQVHEDLQDLVTVDEDRGHGFEFTEQFDAVELVNTEHRIRIQSLRHIDERQRCEISPDERNIRRETRDALVHVLEGLEVAT